MNIGFKLLICEHFKAETEKILSSGDFSDVTPVFFSPRCGFSQKKNEDFSLYVGSQSENSETIICGCSCLRDIDIGNLSNSYFRLDNCFYMLFQQSLLEPYITDGCYIISPGWLSTWKKNLEQYGDAEIVRQMFSETV